MDKHSGASIPFSNDPKLHDKIGNRKTDLKALADSSFRHGVEYMEAAIYVMERRPDYGSVIGANMAFSCELFLKSMLYAENIDVKKKHNLFELYKLLPDNMQNTIKTAFKEVPMRGDQNFELLMSEVGDAFVFQRYAHERNRLTVDGATLFGLAAVLRAIIQANSDKELE